MVVGKIFLFDVILNINKDIKKKYIEFIYLIDQSNISLERIIVVLWHT